MTAMPGSQEIAALRLAGAAHFDAVQLHYLETLSRRLLEQPQAVRRRLEIRLRLSLSEFTTRFAKAQGAARLSASLASQRHPQSAASLQRLLDAGHFKELALQLAALDAQESPLAALARSVAQPPGDGAGNVSARPELKAVQQFRNTWSRLSADRQMLQAMDQAPVNAGPINSHMLVLRSLALMRDISPDYLNRFMAYADGLLCLQQSEADKHAKATAELANGKKTPSRRSKARPSGAGARTP